MQVLLYCHHDDWDVEKTYDVELTLAGLPEGSMTVRHYRIDAEHSNAYAEWLRQGKPNYPNEGQYAAIKARDGLELLTAPETVEVTGNSASLHFEMPVHAVSLLTFERNETKKAR